MIMSPGARRFALTAHVTTSVGWLGAVSGFLVLALSGLTAHDTQTVRAAYLAMELLGWCLIVPLSFAITKQRKRAPAIAPKTTTQRGMGSAAIALRPEARSTMFVASSSASWSVFFMAGHLV